MIDIDSLLLERDEKRYKYNQKYEQKLNVKKEIIRNKIDVLVDIYSKDHSEEETKRHRKNLEDEATLKLNKIISRYEKKKAKYHKKTEIPKKIKNGNRIWEIDFLRGVAICGMMFDHFMYDFTDIFIQIFQRPFAGWLGRAYDFTCAYWENDFRIFVRLFGVALFVFLCGVSTRFSKSNIKRSLELVGVGAAISLASIGVAELLNDDSFYILFSTIFMIGFCLLCYSVLELIFKLLFKKKGWKWVCLALGVAGTIFWTYLSCKNFLSHENTRELMYRRLFYIYNDNAYDMMIQKGVPWRYWDGWTYGTYKSIEKEFFKDIFLGLKGFGADWLGFFPYINYIFLGAFVGETVYKSKKSIIHFFYSKEDTSLRGIEYARSNQGKLNAKLNRILAGVIVPGRHTLFVYVFHQPIFILIMSLIIMATGYKLNLTPGFGGF